MAEVVSLVKQAARGLDRDGQIDTGGAVRIDEAMRNAGLQFKFKRPPSN